MTGVVVPRCAQLARSLDEAPTGKASPIRSLLAVEHPGPWPKGVADAFVAELLGGPGADHLARVRAEHRLKVLLVRRVGRSTVPETPSVFVGAFHGRDRWVERVAVRRHADVARIDLEAVARGQRGHGDPVDEPLLLVCTHGRKDTCCAMYGRPVADALAARHPGSTWQCTHYGGDRFAGNLLVVPHGLMYGNLDPAAALETVAAVLTGEVPLRHLRGRVGLSPFAQHAEIAVRERTGLQMLDAVTVVDSRIDDRDAVVEVDAQGSRHHVVLRRRATGPERLSSCSDTVLAGEIDVVSVQPAT